MLTQINTLSEFAATALSDLVWSAARDSWCQLMLVNFNKYFWVTDRNELVQFKIYCHL